MAECPHPRTVTLSGQQWEVALLALSNYRAEFEERASRTRNSKARRAHFKEWEKKSLDTFTAILDAGWQ